MAYTLQIRGDERVAFVGKTGSGKSYAAHALARPLRRLIVLDPKGMLDPRHWRLQPYDLGTELNPTVQEFAKGAPGRYLIRAPVPGATRLPDWEAYLAEVWAYGYLTCYIDEMYGVVLPGTRPGPILSAFYTRGRERRVGTWAASQRPHLIPLFSITEAEWLLMFRLQLDKDKQRLAEMMGPAAMNRIRDPYGFYLYNTMWDTPLYAESLEVGPDDTSARAEMTQAAENLQHDMYDNAPK